MVGVIIHDFYDVMSDNVADDCGYCSDNLDLVGNMDFLAGIRHYMCFSSISGS